VRRALPATAEVALPDLTLAVVHNGGPESGRLERMRRRFPDAGGVVFGHSHIPLHQVAPDGFFILNPGSATDRRRQPRHSMVELTVKKGSAPRIAFLAVDEPAGPLPDELVRR
jgi:predicted phosphodiesterase